MRGQGDGEGWVCSLEDSRSENDVECGGGRGNESWGGCREG